MVKDGSREKLINRIEFSFAGLATVIIVSLHFALLRSAGGLWRDEVNTAAFSEMSSLSAVWDALRYDSVPLVSTLILRAWAVVSPNGDFGFRVFGFLVGIGLLLSMWNNARVFGGRTPLFGLTLLGFNVTAIRYVDSVRPYGLGCIFIVLTFGLVWRAVESPSLRRWVTATLFAVLSVQTLYTNAPLIGAIVIAGAVVSLFRSGLRAAMGVFAIGGIAALSLVPYLGAITQMSESIVVAKSVVSWRYMGSVIWRTVGSGSDEMAWLWISCLVVCLGIAFFVQLVNRRSGCMPDRVDQVAYASGAFVLGIIAFMIMLASADVPTQSWYYLPLMSVVVVAVEGIFAAARLGPWPSRAGLVLLTLVVVTMMPNAWRATQSRQTNIDLLAEYVNAHSAPGDFVVVTPWFNGITFGRYAEDEISWMTAPPLEELRIHRYDLVMQAMLAPDALDPLFEGIESALRSGHSIWLVGAPSFARADTNPTRALPLPPLPETAWSSEPYLRMWSRQTGFFLRRHARQIVAVSVPIDSRVSSLENVLLLKADGWRAARGFGHSSVQAPLSSPTIARVDRIVRACRGAYTDSMRARARCLSSRRVRNQMPLESFDSHQAAFLR